MDDRLLGRIVASGASMNSPSERDHLRHLLSVGRELVAEHDTETVLDRVLHEAAEITTARYAALGVLDESRSQLERFITVGIDPATRRSIGDLPRGRGVLGVLIEDPRPLRLSEVGQHPHSYGFPVGHPEMHTFLGVPILIRGEAWGNLYLAEKEGGVEFTQEDEEIVIALAQWAAIAIENARLYERSRELSVVEERNRVARELHDSVTQNLFGVVLAADAAATLLDRDPDAARVQLQRVQELARAGMDELRSLIFELRPAALADEGLAATLRKHVGILRRVHQQDISFKVAGTPRLGGATDGDVFRIAQEAVHNAVRHAGADHIAVGLDARNGHLVLTVDDDGVGFDPAAAAMRARRLGLTSMEERAKALGGALTIDSRPGAGTRVRLDVGG